MRGGEGEEDEIVGVGKLTWTGSGATCGCRCERSLPGGFFASDLAVSLRRRRSQMERLHVLALGGRSKSDSRVFDAINASDLAVSLRSRRFQLERPYGVAAERRCEIKDNLPPWLTKGAQRPPVVTPRGRSRLWDRPGGVAARRRSGPVFVSPCDENASDFSASLFPPFYDHGLGGSRTRNHGSGKSRSFHRLKPLNLLAHLPPNIDQHRPSGGEVRDVWPRGHCHPFCLLDRPVLVSASVSISGVSSWSLRGFLVLLGSVWSDHLGILLLLCFGTAGDVFLPFYLRSGSR
ncbi:hypothetical protein DY000_02030715 [Brassica cretica]|uniref:Uncharacterized protein n=1 Tax=Brassica cretica TaxID=69181 RepID=A0ABQ7DHU9_BRACR|nr:hypothetical protein DY000_02030715 [Brassica cretica]